MPIVSINKTNGDDYEAIEAAVRACIEQCGGLEDIIKPGYKVIIKPNFVAVPTSRKSGAVTRWEVCKAIADLVKEVGAIPIIAESASAGADTQDVILFCEYNKLQEEGYRVEDLKPRPKSKIEVENGKLIEELNTWDLVQEADAIISVPVLKTHDQTEVTLGMKNLKGLISDSQKKKFHTIGVVDGVVDMIQTLKPVLSVIDGTYGQEGIGPVFGDTVHMGLIVASKDIVACDAVGSMLMGYEPEEVRMIEEAYSRGLGEIKLENIELKGDKLEDCRRRFKRANETEIEGLPPHHLIVDEGACTGCKNTVIAVLMDLKEEELLSHLEGKYIAVGPVKELPEGATYENTILVGKCTNCLNGLGTKVVGCPPENAYIKNAIIGE